MKQIGHGIDVYYENDYKNIILFPDERNICYYSGNMLLEMSGQAAKDLIIDKLKNMIRIFPEYAVALSIDSITSATKWIYGTVESEDLPVATEIFRSCFSETVRAILQDEKAVVECNCIGDFLVKCYEKIIKCMAIFWFAIDSLANINSNVEDPLSNEMFELLRKDADRLYPDLSKKCSNQKVKKMQEYEIRKIITVNIKMPMQVLKFEYCRMRKNGLILRKCANCQRYFIAKNKKRIFCDNRSPQDENRSCKEIGPQIRRQQKRETDPVAKKYHRKYTSKAMAAKRARDNGEDDNHFYNEMHRLSEEYKMYIRGVDNNG